MIPPQKLIMRLYADDMLANTELQGIPLLVLANKMDLEVRTSKIPSLHALGWPDACLRV